jgi:hypothetical protein
MNYHNVFQCTAMLQLKFIFETFYLTSNRQGDKQSKVSEFSTLNYVTLREFSNFKFGIANKDRKTFRRNYVNVFVECRHTCVYCIGHYIKFLVDIALLSNITN